MTYSVSQVTQSIGHYKWRFRCQRSRRDRGTPESRSQQEKVEFFDLHHSRLSEYDPSWSRRMQAPGVSWMWVCHRLTESNHRFSIGGREK